MKHVAIGIAVAWASVAFIAAMLALDEYSPALCALAIVTLFGGGIGFAFHLTRSPY
ncbi:hypothetical protein GOC13_24525 [Sinorhizobium meliloti]|nr:hypothetical protein [Sinorhizobium meliloti]